MQASAPAAINAGGALVQKYHFNGTGCTSTGTQQRDAVLTEAVAAKAAHYVEQQLQRQRQALSSGAADVQSSYRRQLTRALLLGVQAALAVGTAPRVTAADETLSHRKQQGILWN